MLVLLSLLKGGSRLDSCTKASIRYLPGFGPIFPGYVARETTPFSPAQIMTDDGNTEHQCISRASDVVLSHGLSSITQCAAD
jgi:hypothetical protein